MKYLHSLIFGIALLAVSATSQAITLGFSPTTQDVSLGSSVSVDLTILGLGDYSADSLGGVDIDVTFDGSILDFTGASYGDQLDLFSLGSITSTTLGSGVVNLFELSFDPVADLEALQAGAFTLATLTFDTLAAGTSLLDIGAFTLSDAWGIELAAAEIAQGSINVVSAVPEPGSLLLMGTALFGLIGLRKRQH